MRKNDKKNFKPFKQLTLDKLPNVEKESNVPSSNTPEKRIVITEISTATKEDELALKITFKLIPSKTFFSKVQLDLFFNDQQINSKTIRIIQGSLAKDDFEFTPTLDMRGIPAGSYALKVEIYDLWPSSEKLSEAKKEVIVDYVPQTRESKFVRVPIIKSVAGTGFSVISESEKDIYNEIEKTMKKEYISNRDDW